MGWLTDQQRLASTPRPAVVQIDPSDLCISMQVELPGSRWLIGSTKVAGEILLDHMQDTLYAILEQTELAGFSVDRQTGLSDAMDIIEMYRNLYTQI